MSKNSVNNWVQGRSIPNAFHTVAMAELLGVTAEELVGVSSQPRPPVRDPLLSRLAEPQLAHVIMALAKVAPELQQIVTEATRRSEP